MPTPKITSNRYLIKSFLDENIRRFAISLPSINVRILDVGCGKKPYYKYFRSSYYVGIDKYSQEADIIAVAEKLPIRSSCFDIVLCTQVLEHVEQPIEALKEMERVLRDSGLLILSTHGFWIEEHEPEDYWRWTFQGLTKILNECGFKIVKHTSMEPITSLFQTFLLYIPQKTVFSPLIACINIIAMILRRILKNRGPKLHIDHIIIAKNREELLAKRWKHFTKNASNNAKR
ncbi:MAG: hypothetical protein DRO40_04325 [Thermoprotei archaeon]|nr:MAG: hypothetical protein DRO40_04325 [Thermoprotei archaeon]